MTQLTERWQNIFAGLALKIAEASKDPSTKVGAVIYRPDRSIASMGFNGLPPGLPDDPEKLKDRDWKLKHTRHAERNAIDFLAEFSPFANKGFGIVTTFMPCADCARYIAEETGITTVYYLKASKEAEERWACSFAETRKIFEEAGIAYFEISQ